MKLNTARLFVRNIKEAKNFYSSILGLPIKEDGSEQGYCVFDAGAATLVVELADGEDRDLVGRFTGLSFDVPDAQASYELLRAKAVTFNEPPKRQPWGGVVGTFVDPFDNVLQICQQPSEPGVALCLSGGGFRATFFHLGVVRYLSEIGLLPQVRYVFSVSGGSILAAHMALNWGKYISPDKDEFHNTVQELIKFGQINLRGRIVHRSPFTNPTESLERSYQDLFGQRTLDSLPKRPTFYFLATNMAIGRLCALSRDGLFTVQEHDTPGFYDPTKRFRKDHDPAARVRISQAVAASSAFPPLFPPLILGEKEGLERQALTDGGVFDNLGISRIHVLEDKELMNPIIVSDASAQFKDEDEDPFDFPLSRNIRTTDILMRRVASLENEHWYEEDKLNKLHVIDIAHVVNQSEVRGNYKPLDDDVQRELRRVRTDLDQFEPDLIRCLAGHGHEVAFAKLARFASSSSRSIDIELWDPIGKETCPDGEKLKELVRKAASPRFTWSQGAALFLYGLVVLDRRLTRWLVTCLAKGRRAQQKFSQ